MSGTRSQKGDGKKVQWYIYAVLGTANMEWHCEMSSWNVDQIVTWLIMVSP